MAKSSKLSASYLHELPSETSAEGTRSSGVEMVRYAFDPQNPPALTDAQKAELAALAARSDDDIDFSDIPPLTDDFFKNAVRGQFYRPVKEQITARLDADIVQWLKSAGKGYQSRMNAILRREMLASRTKPA